MRHEIENRLHRVKIKLGKNGIVCPHTKECKIAENCSRCNDFYQKCVIFTGFISESK